MSRGIFGGFFAPGLKAATLDQLPDFLFEPASRTGISITYSTALQVTAMYACARVVGEGLAQSRCRLMRPRAGGKGADVASGDHLHQLVFVEPRKGETAFSFWETIAFHLMLVGNAYVFLNRVGDERLHEMLLLEPSMVRVTSLSDRSLRYEVADSTGALRSVPTSNIWHIRGPSWNGWMGMEAIRLAREALGLSLSLERSHADLHASGTKESGILSVEGNLTAPEHDKMTAWLKRYAAAGDLAGDAMILDRGAKWFSRQMSGVDLQHLETRRFQIEEVCRAARVLPIMVGLTDKASTYASVEQMLIAHVVHTLSPWAGRLEQAAEVGLLSEAERRAGLTFHFNLSALMRGNYKDRQEGLQIQRRNGVINANEWRDLENWNPREDDGGNQYIVEANMALQDGRDLPVTSAPAPTPTPTRGQGDT